MNKRAIEKKIKTLMHKESYKPLSQEELLERLSLSGKELKAFWSAVADLTKNGDIVKTRYNTYGLPEKMNLVVGTLSLTQKGYGFLLPDNKEIDDVFLPPGSMIDAMHGDHVMVRINSRSKDRKQEGEIIRVLTRKTTSVVGVFNQRSEYAFVTPDDRRINTDIFVAKKNFAGAKDGQKVVVQITVWPSGQKNAEGKVVEVLGNVGDIGLEILSIIKQHDLPVDFSDRVLSAAARIPDIVGPQELEGRRDLRNRMIFTIDGEDAKDLDDAVYVEETDAGWLLGVYIADVSYYVVEDTPLDLEARERGTSVYLADRVLPMLPERLSNGICSLNAGQDRLVMSCEMRISSKGDVVSYEIFPAVIKVNKRLSYPVVRQVVDDENLPSDIDIYSARMLKRMGTLSKVLRKKRLSMGAVDFDFPEQKIILDVSGKPVDILQIKRSIAESIIEEFMLLANQTVAKHLSGKEVPSLYRVHEEPDEDKITALTDFLSSFAIKLSTKKKVVPSDFQAVLTKIKNTPEETLISKVMLRSLKQARYSAENVGHFGLSAKYYTHFTSPIRRYPDLVVHRLLKETAKNKMTAKRREKLAKSMTEIAEHASERERAAEQAERDTKDLKKAEYMLEHIGEEFSGIISGVTSYGLFVELESGVEGLLHMSALLDDYYVYVEKDYSLVGEASKKVYRLGDELAVEVFKVDVAARSVDFILPGQKPQSKPAPVKTGKVKPRADKSRVKKKQTKRSGRSKKKSGR